MILKLPVPEKKTNIRNSKGAVVVKTAGCAIFCIYTIIKMKE